MKTIFKSAVAVFILVSTLLPVQFVPEADAILGFWRRNVRRAVIIGGAAAMTTAAVAQQQAATAQQQAATAQQQAAAQQQSAASEKPLPLGTVVTSLPGGCSSTPVGGVEYYYCGGNFYRAVFQGNKLVYVTAQPK